MRALTEPYNQQVRRLMEGFERRRLETDDLSAYLDRQPTIERGIDQARRGGDRVGICLPVLCEYCAGIRLSRRHPQNLARLAALRVLRLWPIDEATAEFAAIFRGLRDEDKMLPFLASLQ